MEKTRLDYLMEYRQLRTEAPYESYVYWLAMYLIHQYVNEWLAYILTVLYVLAVIGKANFLNKVDNNIEQELEKINSNHL